MASNFKRVCQGICTIQRMINTWVESSAAEVEILAYVCRHILARAYPRIQAPDSGVIQMLLAPTEGEPLRRGLAIAATYSIRCSSSDLGVNDCAWFSLL